jgi:hypothetical protein
MKLKQHIKLVKSFKANVNEWKNNFDSVEYKEASKVNQKLFGIPLNKRKNCDCVNDLLSYVSRMDNEKIKLKQEQMESKFKLKKGKLIMLHGLDIEISESNLTDAKAISLLKKYPGHITTFESFPDNWEELTLDDSPVIVEDTIEPAEEIAVEKKAPKKGKRKSKK